MEWCHSRPCSAPHSLLPEEVPKSRLPSERTDGSWFLQPSRNVYELCHPLCLHSCGHISVTALTKLCCSDLFLSVSPCGHGGPCLFCTLCHICMCWSWYAVNEKMAKLHISVDSAQGLCINDLYDCAHDNLSCASGCKYRNICYHNSFVGNNRTEENFLIPSF